MLMKEQKYTVVVNSVMELMIAIDLKLNNLKIIVYVYL